MTQQITQEEIRRAFSYRNGWLYWRVFPHKNSRVVPGDRAGCAGGHGYWIVILKGKKYRAHRAIYLWHHGWMPAQIDHINGNSLDNRIENLRPATPRQNQCNMKLSRANTSGVKGVSWAQNRQKWLAQCRVNGKPKFIGYYNTLQTAKIAVRKFRELHHKEFARHK